MGRLQAKDLEEMLARCEGATPGPWESLVEGRDHCGGSSFIKTMGDDIELSGATAEDQDFIANARQDVPRLVAEIRYLRGKLRSVE